MQLKHARPKVWTRREYHLAAAALQSQARTELIEGTIVEMSPQNPPHALTVAQATSLLVRAFDSGYVIMTQSSLPLSETTEPEPDFALIRRGRVNTETPPPWNADLLVEVADSSLTYDSEEKASLYARHGVPELWVVAIPHRTVLVFRQPEPDDSAPFGWSYAARFEARDAVAPLFAPEQCLLVAEFFSLLPPKERASE